MTPVREKAQERLCREMRKARIALGHAEEKPGATEEELSNLRDKVAALDWLLEMMGCSSGSRWICVRDRLPEDNQRVLFVPTCNQSSVYVGQYAFVGQNGGVMFAHRDGRSKTNYYAKYWMPLPEPPKEE